MTTQTEEFVLTFPVSDYGWRYVVPTNAKPTVHRTSCPSLWARRGPDGNVAYGSIGTHHYDPNKPWHVSAKRCKRCAS